MRDSYQEKVLPKKSLLFRIALRLLGNHQDAEDALSETLMKMWIARDKISSYKNLDGVLYATIRNQSIDIIRKRKPTVEINDITKITSEHARESHLSKTEVIEQIISELPEKQKLVIHLRMVEQMTMSQIAEIVNEKVNTVEVLVSRARKKIRTEYENRQQEN